MKMWIARHGNGLLYLYKEKPTLDEGYWVTNGFWTVLNLECFPEVTFENSPMEVELVIKK